MIFEFITNVAINFFMLFPPDPFADVNKFLHNEFFINFFGYINYFVPWDWIFLCFKGWSTCIISYFILSRVSHK